MKIEATAPRKGNIREQVQKLVLKADTDDEMILLSSITVLARDGMLDEFLGSSAQEPKRKGDQS